MKKLKTILQSKYFFFILIIITFIYVYYKNVTNVKTRYDGSENNFLGIIDKIDIDGNKLTIELKTKEKILVIYYIKTEQEKDYISNNYFLGDKIKISGTLHIPKENTVFNLFNYRNYLKSKKIYWILNCAKLEKIQNNVHLKYKIKNFIINKISNIEKSSAYLKTFILGDTSLIDQTVLDSYRNNGISHLFSVSGMHVTIMSAIIFFILNKILKNNFFKYFIVIIFLIFYMFLTNYSPSIIRATLLFIFGIFNKELRLNVKTINILLLICIILLFYNPFYIYNLGFVFSFVVTFYLILFSDLINNHKNYFFKIFITSVIAFLAGLPIVINNFFNVNILSIFLNIFFVSFVSIILFPLLLLTFFIPIFDNLLYMLIIILENVSLLFSKIDLLNITLCKINFLFVIFYYILITLILYFFKKNNYQLIFILLFVIFIHNNILFFSNDLIITMIDVGQGDSTLISLPHNKGNILIDTGGIITYSEEWQSKKSKYSIAIDTIIPYLKSIGIKKLDYLILSHGDYDHIGEAINLVNNFKVEKVIFNCGEFNELERDLIKVLDKKKISYYFCIKELNTDDKKLYFLNNKDYDNENDNSNVIYTVLNNYKFLFMGDAGVKVEEALIEKYNLQDIDVLKVGHHGSKTSSSKVFIDEIEPKYSIISVGKNNRYGHPHESVLDNLENSKIYRTDKDGSIMFKIKNSKLNVEICAP